MPPTGRICPAPILCSNATAVGRNQGEAHEKGSRSLQQPQAALGGRRLPGALDVLARHHGQQVSPFLLLDYAGPAEFAPAAAPRGVGVHPHRGFETVTIVYQGEVEHRNSTGNGGVIGPGDVQWMTAASGILHEEFHSRAFTRTGRDA